MYNLLGPQLCNRHVVWWKLVARAGCQQCLLAKVSLRVTYAYSYAWEIGHLLEGSFRRTHCVRGPIEKKRNCEHMTNAAILNLQMVCLSSTIHVVAFIVPFLKAQQLKLSSCRTIISFQEHCGGARHAWKLIESPQMSGNGLLFMFDENFGLNGILF